MSRIFQTGALKEGGSSSFVKRERAGSTSARGARRARGEVVEKGHGRDLHHTIADVVALATLRPRRRGTKTQLCARRRRDGASTRTTRKGMNGSSRSPRDGKMGEHARKGRARGRVRWSASSSSSRGAATTARPRTDVPQSVLLFERAASRTPSRFSDDVSKCPSTMMNAAVRPSFAHRAPLNRFTGLKNMLLRSVYAAVSRTTSQRMPRLTARRGRVLLKRRAGDEARFDEREERPLADGRLAFRAGHRARAGKSARARESGSAVERLRRPKIDDRKYHSLSK